MWYSTTVTGDLSPLQAGKEAFCSFSSQSGWMQLRDVRLGNLMQDGQRAHVGPHHCDGGPEPSPGQHKGRMQQVEGMPMPGVKDYAPTHSPQEGAKAAPQEPASSTSGESDTCVDNNIPGYLPACVAAGSHASGWLAVES